MTLEVRAIEDAEVDAFRQSMMATFGHDDAEIDPEGSARMRTLIAPGQAWAAFDGGRIVATAGTLDLAIGVPGGGALHLAGLTMVAVSPTHRRRGLLRALMARHLDDARGRGYPASGLWASESAIYGRFGYGLAAHGDDVTIAEAHGIEVAGGRELDAIEWLDEDGARAQLPAIYERATALRPGVLRRSTVWWRERRFLENPFARGGASKRRHVIARRGDDRVGYLAYRQRPGFLGGVPSGKVEIIELVGLDGRADASLWRYALAIDLHPRVSWWNAPVDDPLPWIVPDARRVERKRTDTLWLRIEDVPATLATRGFASDGALRLGVDDTTWELEVRDGRGHLELTKHAAELRMSRATLGTLFLGAASATQLARAGLVAGEAAVLARADRLFAASVAPWCPEVF